MLTQRGRLQGDLVEAFKELRMIATKGNAAQDFSAARSVLTVDEQNISQFLLLAD